jgi:hypothetical protein
MFNHFNNQINLACHRCKSTNISIGRDINIDPKKNIKCNDCHYFQFVFRLVNQ